MEGGELVICGKREDVSVDTARERRMRSERGWNGGDHILVLFVKGDVRKNLSNVQEQVAEAGGEIEIHPSEFDPVLMKRETNTVPWRRSRLVAFGDLEATRTPRPS